MQGPVLQPFAYDESHPYASGQHRGIDIGADAAGEQVVAPAAGTVTFAGSVPTNGESLTIQTPDGYTVTLTHLGATLVAKGTAVDEGQAVATIGPSGTPEFDRPYVHLGIRATADPNGYLDPLGLLPPPTPESPPAQSTPAQTTPAQTTPAQNSPAVPQPSTTAASASAPAQPAPAVAASTQPVATTRGSTVSPGQRSSSVHERPRAQKPRVDLRPQRPSRRPASQHATADDRVRLPLRNAPEQASAAAEPTAEPTAPGRAAGLDAGHEIQEGAPVEQPAARPHSGAAPLPLVLNGAAALVALAAALGARRRRSPVARAEIVHLPRPGPLRRAA